MRGLPVVVALLALTTGARSEAATTQTVDASAPRVVGFADELTYVVEAAVPSDGAARARLVAGVGAFTVLQTEPLERERRGDVTLLRLRRTLACLDEACLGPGPTRPVVIPAPHLSSPSGSARGAETTVVVRGRIPRDEVRAGLAAYRRDSATPPPTDGPSPNRVAVALAALAAVALLAALALVAVPKRGGRPAPFEDDPYARAVRLLRESARKSEPDRRRAADLLARLAGDRDAGLETRARHVAWSPPQPSATEVEALAEQAARERG